MAELPKTSSSTEASIVTQGERIVEQISKNNSIIEDNTNNFKEQSSPPPSNDGEESEFSVEDSGDDDSEAGDDSEDDKYSSDSDAYTSESSEDSIVTESEEEYISSEDEDSYGRPRSKRGRGRPRMNTHSTQRNHVPPMTIPIQYRTHANSGYPPIISSGAYPPIISPQLSSIPMFNRPVVPASTNFQSSPQNTANSFVNPGTMPMQNQNTPLAAPEPSPELKQHLAGLLMANPEWRSALQAKMAQNKLASAQQAANLGVSLQPTANLLPSLTNIQPQIAIPGYVPSSLNSYANQFHPMHPINISRQQYNRQYHPYVPKPPKENKEKKNRLQRLGVSDPLSIPSRREPRQSRTSVNYQKYYNDDDDQDDSEDLLPHKRTSDIKTKTPSKDINVKRKAIIKDEECSSSSYDDNSESGDDYGDDDKLISHQKAEERVGVEKILSYRQGKDEREFYVKFHNMSHLHCDWIGEEEILMERMGSQRIKRFLSEPLSQRHFSSSDIFNPEFVEIERIIWGWEHEDPEDPKLLSTSYLVKWVGLPYMDAMWEKKVTILSLPDGEDMLKEFEKRLTLEERKTSFKEPGYRPPRQQYKALEKSPTFKGDNELRNYQLEGLNWLTYCWNHQQSCIIADEMGLGKTVQSVSFLNHLHQQIGIKGPFLVVAPLSTIPHWTREFASWTDLNCIFYHGNQASRDVIREYEWSYKDPEDPEKEVKGLYKFDVLITTYEMAIVGIEHLSSVGWRAAIFDEAHRLKNTASKATETLKDLRIEHKVLLSGTPLQNNLNELWSLLNFLQPQRFSDEDVFIREYGNMSKNEDVLKIQALLRPLMLRRLKEDVEKSIPVKEETVIEVELTSLQKRFYRAILERNFGFLTKGCEGSNQPNLMNAMMELRKCCIHPYLIKGAEERILKECTSAGFDSSLNEQMQCMIQASGKLVLVDKLLKKLRENGHRVLIFSQMTKCLDLLVDYLKWRNYPWERIDGSIKGEHRQASIDRFSNLENDSFVFLLCTKAGGVGINLTAADTVVIFDSDWNPQNDIQAQARCHRIGQKKSVKVYRLLTRNTYEREMFDKAGMKLGLDKAVLGKMRPSRAEGGNDDTSSSGSHNPQLSKTEVENLLKKGAYGLLMENDDDSIKFCEEDIDQILERRSTVISSGGDTGKTSSEGSIFSKASFAAQSDDLDIDMDDPNFWELWARKLNLDPRQLLNDSGVIIDEPRIKRQSKRIREESLLIDDFMQSISIEVKNPLKECDDNLWIEDERLLFLRHIMLFGVRRWDSLLKVLVWRSKNDLISCVRALVKFCCEYSSTEDDIKFSEDTEKMLLSHLEFDRSQMEKSSKDDEVVDIAEYELKNTSSYQDNPLKSPTSPLLSPFSGKLDSPWSGATSKQCSEYQSFLKLASDSLLEALKTFSRPILLRIQLLDFLSQAVNNHNNMVTTSAVDGVDGDDSNKIPIPHIFGSPPYKGWGKVEDEVLVMEMYDNGFGLFDDLQKKKPFSEVDFTLKGDTGNELIVWPSKDILEDRVKKVILALEKKSQAAAKLAIQAMTHAKEGTRRRGGALSSADAIGSKHSSSSLSKEVHRRNRRRRAFGASSGDDDNVSDEEHYEEEEENTSYSHLKGSKKIISKSQKPKMASWTKKDKIEFQRLVLLFGYPPEKRGQNMRAWSSFMKHGSFSQSLVAMGELSLQEYSILFLKKCKKVLAAGKDDKNMVATVVDTEDEDDSSITSKNDPPEIPLERAKRSLNRIELFDDIRVFLSLDNIGDLMLKARRSPGLPPWWKCYEHDVELLRAIEKHGFNSWDKIFEDPDYSFEVDSKAELERISSSDSPVKGRSAKRKASNALSSNSSGWPGESILTRRVESLTECIRNELFKRKDSQDVSTSVEEKGKEKKVSTKKKVISKEPSLSSSSLSPSSSSSPKKPPRAPPKKRITSEFPPIPKAKKSKQTDISSFVGKKNSVEDVGDVINESNEFEADKKVLDHSE